MGMMGTDAGDKMMNRAEVGGWNNPMFNGDSGAGAVRVGEGQLLYGLVRALLPDVVVEVGTGQGYATVHLAAGCRDNGKGIVHTVEIEAGRHLPARKHFVEAGLADWIIQHQNLPDPKHIDLLFLDAGHDATDVDSYLNGLAERIDDYTTIVIHDAGWGDHVREVMGRRGWPWVYLPTTSRCGIAFSVRRNLEGCLTDDE